LTPGPRADGAASTATTPERIRRWTRAEYAASYPSRSTTDRGTKAALYARARLADYWILDLVDRVLEVSRRPAAVSQPSVEWRDRDVTILRETASIVPLARPDGVIDVAALLPTPGRLPQMTPSRRSVSMSSGATPSSLP
jgi:hypothetical protein